MNELQLQTNKQNKRVKDCLAMILLLLLLLLSTIFIFIFLLLSIRWWRRTIEECFHVYQFLRVPQLNNQTMQHNHLYTKLSLYLHSLPSIQDTDFSNLLTGTTHHHVVISLGPNQTIHDQFLGANLTWSNEPTAFVLKITKADRRRILRPYLHHIHAVAAEIDQQGKRDLRLFINADAFGTWRSVPFTHPSTFDTITMEPDLKSRVKSDLESFLKAKQYYHRIGRVWKRSFLLYGPSGTGKSSFVAAMANFLCYDVYDIDLSKVQGDSDLKFLLLQTTPRSVVVVEDLDRFVAEKLNSKTAVTASGMLNFMDGVLSSCCGEERVMVFTMNSKENVDPNLLRPGRVDVHIHFPLCDFSAFKTLASSYLGVKDHKLFPQVQEIFQNGASLSAAEIGELMIANRNSPSRAIKSVITALQTDGDGRGCGLTRRDAAGEDVEVNGTVKDLRKLYGLFRLRVGRRPSSSPNSSLASPLR